MEENTKSTGWTFKLDLTWETIKEFFQKGGFTEMVKLATSIVVLMLAIKLLNNVESVAEFIKNKPIEIKGTDLLMLLLFGYLIFSDRK